MCFSDSVRTLIDWLCRYDEWTHFALIEMWTVHLWLQSRPHIWELFFSFFYHRELIKADLMSQTHSSLASWALLHFPHFYFFAVLQQCEKAQQQRSLGWGDIPWPAAIVSPCVTVRVRHGINVVLHGNSFLFHNIISSSVSSRLSPSCHQDLFVWRSSSSRKQRRYLETLNRGRPWMSPRKSEQQVMRGSSPLGLYSLPRYND